jgi:hypothetical protein
MPVFSVHVVHVVGLRADKQVSWVDAASVVTAMQYTSAVMAGEDGDRPEVNFPTHAMSRAFPTVADSKQSVSGIRGRRYPFPAGIGVARENISPKSRADFFVGDNYAMPELPTGVRAIAFLWAPGDCARLDLKFDPARLAFKDNSGPWALVATRKGAKPRVSISLAKQVAANFAWRVAMFDRWCHATIIALNYSLIDIIRKYGLAGLMAPGALAPAYGTDR